MNNKYENDDVDDSSLEEKKKKKIIRHILHDKPRITYFNIDWNLRSLFETKEDIKQENKEENKTEIIEENKQIVSNNKFENSMTLRM